MLVISITSSAADGSGLVRDYRSMLSRQGGLNLEIKCPCTRKTWHEREVGVFFKWAYFHETTVYGKNTVATEYRPILKIMRHYCFSFSTQNK